MVFIASGCGWNEDGAHEPAEQSTQSEHSRMAKSVYIPNLEYRVYKRDYRVVAYLDESGRAQIRVIETIEGHELSPAIGNARLDTEAKKQLNKIVGQLRLGTWNESLVVTKTRAALILDSHGATWPAETLGKDGVPRELRKWVEANLNLAMHASEVARERVAKAEDERDIKKAAHACKEAIDRLETWWIPEGPVRDETGTMYSDGKVCLQHEDYERALGRFMQVLEKRAINYRKKYGR